MLLIIFLCLIATLNSVSLDGGCGNPEMKDFDWYKFSGPRPWYFLLHKPNEFENQISCPISIFASPVGNRSIITSDVYLISNETHVIIPGYATNWNSSGYFDVYDENTIWTGLFHIIAVDYDQYVIFNLHPFYTNETPLYVGYRTSRPNKETVEEVKQKLQENNIDESQLENWPADHCQVPDSSTKEEPSTEEESTE